MRASNGLSRRCSMCDINYPTYIYKCKVDDCSEETWVRYKEGPDEDWEELVEFRNRGVASKTTYDATLNLKPG